MNEETPGFLVSVALGSVFLVTGTIVNAFIAYLAALGARRVGGRSSRWIRNRIPATVLIFLGLRLLWQNPWSAFLTRFLARNIDYDFLLAVAVHRVHRPDFHLADTLRNHHAR